MTKNFMIDLLRFAAIFGNVIFILWIAYNAIDEGFRGTIYQIISGIGIILLLILNTILLSIKRGRSES